MASAAASAVPTPPVFIDAAAISSVLTYKSLISHLRSSLPSLSATLQSPLRHSHTLSSPSSASASLLLMPSWSSSPLLPYLGVKLVTHFPHNSLLRLPTVHASYSIFSAATGTPLASLDGTQLTLHRTAAVSALASTYLSAPSPRVLVMVGAGSLAPHLIKAHLAARPTLATVLIWNRTQAKAQALAAELAADHPEVEEFAGVDCLDEAVGLGDIVSCATNSEVALVRGASLKAGTHLDLVGSFTAAMRECDDEAILRGRVFVDSWAAVEEAGELIGAMERGVITREGIVGDLVGLIRGEREGRRGPEEITVFKSAGSAAVDILSAQLVYEAYMKQKQEGHP